MAELADLMYDSSLERAWEADSTQPALNFAMKIRSMVFPYDGRSTPSHLKRMLSEIMGIIHPCKGPEQQPLFELTPPALPIRRSGLFGFDALLETPGFVPGQMQYDGWFNQAQAAREADVHPGIICRMVRDEELRTNGRTGRECLLDPQSVLAYRDRRRKRKEERLLGR